MSSISELLHILSLSDNATAVYSGENIVIEFANSAMLAFLGKEESIIGLELEDGIPELKGQPFKAMLQTVRHTGITDEGIIPAETRLRGQLVVEKTGNIVRISVSDKGPGIPPDQLPHIFKRYFRSHQRSPADRPRPRIVYLR